jgi:hypothetical protein
MANLGLFGAFWLMGFCYFVSFAAYPFILPLVTYRLVRGCVGVSFALNIKY